MVDNLITEEKNMMTLEQLQKLEFQKVKSCGGYWEVKEWDTWLNKFQRAKIRAFKREKGNAYLGKINYYDDERHKPIELKNYKRGRIYNYEFSFIIPVDDKKLKELIYERDNSEYTGTKEDYEKITKITNRIYELGGLHLTWK